MQHPNYTASQMAKLIVLGETVLRRRSAVPGSRSSSALTLHFDTPADASLLEMAIADASAAVYGEPSPIKDLMSRLGVRD